MKKEVGLGKQLERDPRGFPQSEKRQAARKKSKSVEERVRWGLAGPELT